MRLAWMGSRVVVASLASIVVACGGGGGGGSGETTTGGGGSGGGSSTSTGLLPAAPTPGDVLATDALQLRVLRPGAVWTYRGFDQLDGNDSRGTVYTDVVTHAAAAGGTQESASNSDNEGEGASVIVVAAGTVSSSVSVDFTGRGTPDTFDDVELRSPVRVGDQYGIYEKHFEDSGQDYDGDGVHDALDVASWRRVIGSEVLDLHDRRQVQTVRVDQTARVRVRYSKDHTYSDVVEVVQSVWYASGIGIVRVRLDQPNDNTPSFRHVTTEELLAWDGLTEGLGPLPTQHPGIDAASGPDGNTVGLYGAAAFDDHVVVASSASGSPSALRFALTAVDLRGNRLASRSYVPADAGAVFLSPLQLLRVGSELRLVASVDSRLAMLAFDADGQHALAAPITLTADRPDGFDGVVGMAASDGTHVWLAWMADHDSTGLTVDFKVQGFDAAGAAIAAPVLLEQAVPPAAVSTVRIVASANDPVFVSWQSSAAGPREGRYAAIDRTTGALRAMRTTTTTGYALDDVLLEPVAMGPGLALTSHLDPTSKAIVGVALDSAYNAIRFSAGSFASEVITPAWVGPVQGYIARPAGAYGHLFAYLDATAREFPQDTADAKLQTLVEIVPSTTLAASDVRLLARIPWTVGASSTQLQVPLADRVLLVGGKDGTLVTTPVWRVR